MNKRRQEGAIQRKGKGDLEGIRRVGRGNKIEGRKAERGGGEWIGGQGLGGGEKKRMGYGEGVR